MKRRAETGKAKDAEAATLGREGEKKGKADNCDWRKVRDAVRAAETPEDVLAAAGSITFVPDAFAKKEVYDNVARPLTVAADGLLGEGPHAKPADITPEEMAAFLSTAVEAGAVHHVKALLDWGAPIPDLGEYRTLLTLGTVSTIDVMAALLDNERVCAACKLDAVLYSAAECGTGEMIRFLLKHDKITPDLHDFVSAASQFCSVDNVKPFLELTDLDFCKGGEQSVIVQTCYSTDMDPSKVMRLFLADPRLDKDVLPEVLNAADDSGWEPKLPRIVEAAMDPAVLASYRAENPAPYDSADEDAEDSDDSDDE